MLLTSGAIDRLFPNQPHRAIARFRRRSEAEAYLNVVQPLIPQVKFAIVFDPPQLDLADRNSASSPTQIPQTAPL